MAGPQTFDAADARKRFYGRFDAEGQRVMHAKRNYEFRLPALCDVLPAPRAPSPIATVSPRGIATLVTGEHVRITRCPAKPARGSKHTRTRAGAACPTGSLVRDHALYR